VVDIAILSGRAPEQRQRCFTRSPLGAHRETERGRSRGHRPELERPWIVVIGEMPTTWDRICKLCGWPQAFVG